MVKLGVGAHKRSFVGPAAIVLATLLFAGCQTDGVTHTVPAERPREEKSRRETITEVQLASHQDLADLPAALGLSSEDKQAYKDSLDDFLPEDRVGAQSFLGSLLIGVAVDFSAKTVVPELSKKVVSGLKGLWPEKTDAYSRSAVFTQTMDDAFWQLEPADGAGLNQPAYHAKPVCEGVIVKVSSYEVDAKGYKKGAIRLDAVYAMAFAYSQLDPRYMQARPLLWGVRKNAKQMPIRAKLAAAKEEPVKLKLGLMVELNVEFSAFAYTESSAVRALPLLQLTLADTLEEEIDAAKLAAIADDAPGDLRVKVLKKPASRGAFYGTPSFEVGAYPVARAPDASTATAAAKPEKGAEGGAKAQTETRQAGVRLFSQPYQLKLQISERTPDFLKSSKARDWYIGFLDGLEGKLTDSGKKFVEEEGKKLEAGDDKTKN